MSIDYSASHKAMQEGKFSQIFESGYVMKQSSQVSKRNSYIVQVWKITTTNIRYSALKMDIKIVYFFKIKILNAITLPWVTIRFHKGKDSVLFYAISLVGLPDTDKFALKYWLNELTC